eukprot:353793-Chlamydomonas_euryale.AAC.3
MFYTDPGTGETVPDSDDEGDTKPWQVWTPPHLMCVLQERACAETVPVYMHIYKLVYVYITWCVQSERGPVLGLNIYITWFVRSEREPVWRQNHMQRQAVRWHDIMKRGSSPFTPLCLYCCIGWMSQPTGVNKQYHVPTSGAGSCRSAQHVALSRGTHGDAHDVFLKRR